MPGSHKHVSLVLFCNLVLLTVEAGLLVCMVTWDGLIPSGPGHFHAHFFLSGYQR